MRIVTVWLGTVRGLGNSGAVANAARACRDRLDASAAVEAALGQFAQVPKRESVAKGP